MLHILIFLYVQEKDVVAQVDPDLYYNKGIVSKIEIRFSLN
jgi:hypothetical protein